MTSVSYSPDGLRVVSGSWGKTVRIWDAVGFKALGIFKWHSSVRSVALHPQAQPGGGIKLVVGDDSGQVVFLEWTAEKSFQLLGYPKHPHHVLNLSGCVFKGAKMDAMTKRLLAQHKGEVRKAKVSEWKGLESGVFAEGLEEMKRSQAVPKRGVFSSVLAAFRGEERKKEEKAGSQKDVVLFPVREASPSSALMPPVALASSLSPSLPAAALQNQPTLSSAEKVQAQEECCSLM